MGTHGVMCRKTCDCKEKRCHPQTGECIAEESAGAVNVSHVVLETINSTMANLTHNINKIAKRIGSMSEVSHIQVTPSALPEVILIKQPLQEAAHTPKIILHESSNALLENLHTAAAAGVPTPEVIHVITNAGGSGSQEHSPQLNLAGFAAGESNPSRSAHDQDSSLLSTLIVMLLMLMIVITLGFLYVYRRQHLHKEAVVYNANGTFSSPQGHGTGHANPEVVISESSALGKIFHGPLPKPPAIASNQSQTNEGM